MAQSWIISCLLLAGSSQSFRTRRSASCSSFGCWTDYDPSKSCQCNSRCERYRNCCSDFWSTCKGDPVPAPSPPASGCSVYGCFTDYNRSRPCQCNSRCERYNNCCSDFGSKCLSGSPSPTPPTPPSPPAVPSPPPPVGTAPPAPPPPTAGADAYWAGVNMQSLSTIKSKIRQATKLSYTPGVWNAYKSVWVDLPGKCAGKIFDVYSAKCWTTGVEQCGSYKGEGGCYNREHSWPKSWWGGSGSTPAYTDLFHVFPSDGYVNSRRSALPFGEVSSARYISSEGNKVGSCSAGTCFEPIDAIKGLMARSHLYMVTRYGFSLNSASIRMMQRWSNEFPPESWELEMNDRVQKVQRNRNPFIDFPSLVNDLF